MTESDEKKILFSLNFWKDYLVFGDPIRRVHIDKIALSPEQEDLVKEIEELIKRLENQ